MKRHRAPRYERYELEASIWLQNPTQRDVAALLGLTNDQVEAVVRDRDGYVVRKSQVINGKSRQLAIPVRRLRQVHERLKYHLNKIKQPDYLFSPRRGRGQRDNAELHAASHQLLKVDIRQFYPRTTQEDIFRWAYHTLGVRSDVAGLIAKLVAIDGRMPFGSPVSPVLTTLVHRPMFDAVHELCLANDLNMSLWVDDLTISGKDVPGSTVEGVRSIIRQGGFATHRIEHFSNARPVMITGVPVARGKVLAPRALHQRIQDAYASLFRAQSDSDRVVIIDQLLSALGTYRYLVGVGSEEGRRTANRMHALKQRRARLKPRLVTGGLPKAVLMQPEPGGDSPPWIG